MSGATSRDAPHENEVDRFTLVRCLGHNDLGDVWTAEYTSGARATVQLVDDRSGAGTPTAQDVRLSQELEHPNVLRATEWVGNGRGAGYVILEPFPGELLSELLSKGGPLPLERGIRLAVQIAAAVEAAHDAGACHRWLDAGSVLVSRDGRRAVVFGFGVEDDISSSTTEQTHRRCDVPALSGLLDQLLGGSDTQRSAASWSDERIHLAGLLERGRGRGQDLPSAGEIAQSLRLLERAVPRERGAADTLMLQPSRRRPGAGRRWWRMAAGAAAVVALVAASAIGISTIATDDQPAQEQPLDPTGQTAGTDTGVVADGMPVPDVASLSVTDARDTLLDAGFTLAAAEPTAGPPGTVVGTRPAVGTVVEEGAPITLLVGVEPDRLEDAAR